MKRYSTEMKKKIVTSNIQDGRTIASLATEYGVSIASINNWKRDYSQSKKNIQNKIIDIFHATGGIIGHRQMVIFLAREGIKLSKTTVHKFMNKELKLYCIPAKKRPHYVEGTKHEVFPNYISQNFYVEEKTRFGAQTLLTSKVGTGSFNTTVVS